MASDTHLYSVILAGGSGTRFWPASRRERPKQLLPLGPSAPRSLISSTVRRLSPLISEERILVATGAHLVDATRRELPELRAEAFLAEPQAKNTAPAIAWATLKIQRTDPEAVICVLPSDQHASQPEEFRRILEVAVGAARTGAITTIGIVPTRPETGYGYIECGEGVSSEVSEVLRFVEKPDLARAQEYLKQGNYLWNAGIFVYRAKDMLRALSQHVPELYALLEHLEQAAEQGPEAEERALDRLFQECESISIDYAVMEREARLLVVPAEFGWSDLGSWESSWELSVKDENGNAAPSHAVLVDARNNLVEDLRSTPSGDPGVIALLGVEGLCVVRTDDGFLVLPRDRAQDVRDVVARLKDTGRSHLI